ncbi:MAG: TolC family protein [Chitinophagaceae bacterium]
MSLPRTLFMAIGLLSGSLVHAQVSMTLGDCEQTFRKNNLQLLAAQYDIDQAKAQVIQARIWDQPYLSGEFNAINPGANRYFDVGNQGQKAAAVSQLIYLGGKKRNEVAFAKNNQQLAELQFEDLIRNLKLQLRQSFYTLYFDRQNIHMLEFQVSNLDSLVGAYNKQSDLHNISLRDVVRLQALSLQLKKDLLDFRQSINEEEAKLQLITGTSEVIEPSVDSSALQQRFRNITLKTPDDMLQSAVQKNPDFLYTQTLIENNELMLRWQKSLSVPDLTLGGAYDQRGGAFNNQVNVTLGMPLPLWNRNKGNIRSAKAGLEQSKLNKDYKVAELRAQIQTTYANWQQTRNQYLQFSDTSRANFGIVYNGIVQNFQKRNISLLDFTDFIESYNQSLLSLSDMQKQLLFSEETLNYLANESIFE